MQGRKVAFAHPNPSPHNRGTSLQASSPGAQSVPASGNASGLTLHANRPAPPRQHPISAGPALEVPNPRRARPSAPNQRLARPPGPDCRSTRAGGAGEAETSLEAHLRSGVRLAPRAPTAHRSGDGIIGLFFIKIKIFVPRFASQ